MLCVRKAIVFWRMRNVRREGKWDEGNVYLCAMVLVKMKRYGRTGDF